MKRIAGHDFYDTPGGCLCACGMRWGDLLAATEDCVDQEGWAHYGKLTSHEFGEILAEKNRVWESLKA